MKTIFLISGFKLNRTAADAPFDELRGMLASKGYRVVPSPFTWNGQTLSSYVKRFLPFYEENKGEYNIFMGGSFGAMAALLAATQAGPDEIVLCSLSGFFSEDLPHYEQAYLVNKFGQRRLNDLVKTSAHGLASHLNGRPIKITLTYGEKEVARNPILVRRVEATALALNNARVFEFTNAGHKMWEHEYAMGLVQVL